MQLLHTAVLCIQASNLAWFACRQTAGRPATASLDSPGDIESLSTGSFNESSAAEAERSAQSQVSSQAVPDQELIAVAEERLMQAEQRALRAEEATQVCLVLHFVSLLGKHPVRKRHTWTEKHHRGLAFFAPCF